MHDEEIMRDLIDHVMKNHSVRAGMVYINQKYGRDFMYNAVMKALKNEMICGTNRGNPNYCEPYITREEFNQLQKLISRNPRTTERRPDPVPALRKQVDRRKILQILTSEQGNRKAGKTGKLSGI